VRLRPIRRKGAEVNIQKYRQGARALNEPAQLDEAPALVVVHGGIGDPLKQMRPLAHAGQEHMRIRFPLVFDPGIANGMKETIDLFPHSRAGLFANVPRVLTCSLDAAHNGRTCVHIERQRMRDGALRWSERADAQTLATTPVQR
jgi:hypothetical protein